MKYRHRKNGWLSGIPLLLLCSLFATSWAARETEDLELNTRLMGATFKLQGKGSMGTAFILGRMGEEKPKDLCHVLVTAAHVLQNMEDDNAELILRKKKDDKTYETFSHKITIRKAGKPLWVQHEDKDVDVAAMYIEVPEDTHIPLLDISFLADDERLAYFEIHPGDELMCLGYPFGLGWGSGEFPILRSGKIASFPLLPTKKTKGFLYDFEVLKGNSGGPVYIAEPVRWSIDGRRSTKARFIVGMVSKEHVLSQRVETAYEVKEEHHRLGLARVVHASLIEETIRKLPTPR